MKIIAWILCPIFMVYAWLAKNDDSYEHIASYVLIAPVCIAQICYWYVLMYGL